MFGLSQSAGYAVSALTCLESNGCSKGFVKEVAACSEVPPAYLAKLFKRLVDAGILTTKRGWAGGTKLARPAKDIALMDIARVIDGDDWTGRCLLGMAECSDDRACPAHAFWKAERAKIQRQLERISLAEVITFERERARNRARRKTATGGTTPS